MNPGLCSFCGNGTPIMGVGDIARGLLICEACYLKCVEKDVTWDETTTRDDILRAMRARVHGSKPRLRRRNEVEGLSVVH